MAFESWNCDTCGLQIEDPELGLVTWREEGNRGFDYRIVHKSNGGYDCDPGAANGYASSVSIDHYLGDVGQAALLAHLSLGPLAGASDMWPRVKDFDGFVDLFRRLQTPGYEQARGRFADEDVQYWLGDANEYYPYIPEVLARISQGQLGS